MIQDCTLAQGDGLKLFAMRKALVSIPKKVALRERAPEVLLGKNIMSPREAMFAVTERIAATESVGRILAQMNVSCPPAIPIVVCGEIITEEAVKLFKYYGTEYVDVVK